MKRITSLACAALASVSIATAQTDSNPWAIGVYGGLTEYEGELASNMFGLLKDGYSFYGHGGVQVSRFLNRSWDVSLFASYGRIGAKSQNAVAPSSNTVEYKQNELYVDLTAAYKFVKNEKCRFHPYVFAGVGFRNLKTVEDYIGNDSSHPLIAGGVGCDLRLTERVFLTYIARYGYSFNDDADTRTCGKANDQQMMHSFGVKFTLGKADSDKDGVLNKYDECPDTPAGVQVDEKGCPVDSDKDGVPDYLDKCPNTPAGVQVDSVGCPIDSDGDGIADYLDKCPDTPKEAYGKIDENGCPMDSDGDGVPDYLDQCPNTPSAAKGFVDEKGCPTDKDGDGIFDYEDKCPDVPGIKENKGCPEVKAEVKQLFKKALNGVQFETGKSKIKGKTSFAILDDVAKVMQENPEYKLNIGGHTDNVGNPDKNLKLSEDRAASVKAYLESKGVETSRMTSAGYGDTKPVADNKTAKGRAENRRVAFEVEF